MHEFFIGHFTAIIIQQYLLAYISSTLKGDTITNLDRTIWKYLIWFEQTANYPLSENFSFKKTLNTGTNTNKSKFW